jgi:hypothetical protein
MNNPLSFHEMLEHSNTREGGLYKWARVRPAGIEADPEVFRFIHVIYGENHGMLVEKGETALAAGTITVNNDFWHVSTGGWGSTTLKVGCDEEHAQDLESAFAAAGRKLKDNRIVW